jgi:hypothetical protein
MALAVLPSQAASHQHLNLFHHGSNGTLRKRLHVNRLITEPGTVEVEWESLYSYTTGNYSMPSTVKYTPAGSGLFIGNTEYSIAFDSIDSVALSGERVNQFSDRATLGAATVVLDTEHFDVAVAPQITFFLRGESGIRAGATVLSRLDWGPNSLGGTVSWSGATHASDNNPAGAWDVGAGYGRHLAPSGFFSQITPHANVILERATGFERTLAAFAGIEYQITNKIALDVSGQRFGLTGGSPDRQILVGLTVNFGRIRGFEPRP